jgi:signal transduction histidine kinase
LSRQWARQDHLALNRQPCDLVALALGCVEEQRLLAPIRHLTLDLSNALRTAEQSVMVHADAARLGQVVVNYLTNAERYSPADQPIEISLRVAEQPTDQAVEWTTDGAAFRDTPSRVAPSRVAHVSVRDLGPRRCFGGAKRDLGALPTRPYRARNHGNRRSGIGALHRGYDHRVAWWPGRGGEYDG